MFKCGDYFWPDRPGPGAEDFIRGQENVAAYYAQLVPEPRRIAVCAGANVGIMPRIYARYFQRVYAFEPDPENFRCLNSNIAPCESEGDVTASNMGLGREFMEAYLYHDPENCGASYVLKDEAEKLHPIALEALDTFDIQSVDLLQLDVEGMELPALRGAERTIIRCRPVIIVEMKHGERYGWLPEDMEGFMGRLGYKFDHYRRNDWIYRHHG